MFSLNWQFIRKRKGVRQSTPGSRPFNQPKGRLERGFYIQIRRIEQARIRGGLQGRDGAVHVAGIAGANVGQKFVIIELFALRLALQQAAAGAHFRLGGHK